MVTLCSFGCGAPNLVWCKEKAQSPGMKVVRPKINFMGALRSMSVTYTAILPVRDRTVVFLCIPAESPRNGDARAYVPMW